MRFGVRRKTISLIKNKGFIDFDKLLKEEQITCLFLNSDKIEIYLYDN